MTMRLALTIVSPAQRHASDVVLDADPATPVAELAAAFEHFMFGGRAPAAYAAPPATGPAGTRVLQSSRLTTQPQSIPLFVNYQRIQPQLTLAESPIRDGSVISLGSPEGCVNPEPTGLAEIRVIGGPGGGSIHRLGAGEADIGGGPAAAVRIPDPAIPGYALRITVDPQGNCRVAAYEGVKATLDREPLTAAVPWRPGQQIAVGGT